MDVIFLGDMVMNDGKITTQPNLVALIAPEVYLVCWITIVSVGDGWELDFALLVSFFTLLSVN